MPFLLFVILIAHAAHVALDFVVAAFSLASNVASYPARCMTSVQQMGANNYEILRTDRKQVKNEKIEQL